MPDFEFAAAGIMHVFGAYTLEKLFAEPLEIFLQLAALADRISAHRALEYPLVALSAPLQKNDSVLENMRRRRGSTWRRRPNAESVSAESLKAAVELAHRINIGQTTVNNLREYTPAQMSHAQQKG